MSTATRAKPRPAPAPSGAPVVHTRYWVPAGWVRLGMYVADLDRPWLDTPFMLQGFLASTPREIEALQQHCQRVVVDVASSLPEVVAQVLERGEPFLEERPEIAEDHFENASIRRPKRSPDVDHPPAEDQAPDRPKAPALAPPAPRTQEGRALRRAFAPPGAGPPKPLAGPKRFAHGPAPRNATAGAVPKTASGRPSAQGQRSAGFLDWLRSLFGPWRRGPAPRSAAGPRLPAPLAAEIRATLPPDARLHRYPERRSAQAELPRARAAFARGEKELIGMFRDLQGGRLQSIEPVHKAMTDVVASMIDNPNAMLWVAHLRNNHARSYRHALRVALYVVALGRQLGFPRTQLVELAMVGLLADIGNVKVPSELLDRRGMLAPEEFEVVKAHVDHSLSLFAETAGLSEAVRKGIAQHHERMDGSGYPQGLKGTEIGIYGRMAAIADCFAALTSQRPHVDPVTPHQAILNLFDWSRTGFHPPLVEQFVQSIGVFPVGSMVELSSGEVAVVLAHNRVRRLEPRVLLLTAPDKQHLATPLELDLMNQREEPERARVHILKGLPQGAHGLSPRDYYADAAVVRDPADALAPEAE